ncbi:MAG: HAD family phosphatase [Clostridia bacterium]|nr:HAD family phosphatase [Clostridia bacterium]
MLKNIKGAIFDLDGTLVNSLIFWDILWEHFGERFLNRKGFRPTKEEDKNVRTMTLKEAMDYVYSIYGFGSGGDELLDITFEMIEKFYTETVEVKDGVIEFLEHCKKSGIKMCIASATDKRLVKVAAEHCGILKYFDKVFSCADIGKGKDKPDIFLKAMEYLGTTLEESCVFEDSLVAIDTAHKAGFKTVGIYDKYNYGQEEIKVISDVYISDGETLCKLIQVE